MYQYNKIESALTSLSMSTHRAIELKNETFSFDGLNSDYISHQTCNVVGGHGVSNLVVISNTNYVLIVSPSVYNITPSEESGLWRKLPSHLIRELFKFPATVPEWLSHDYCVNVLVPNRLVRFDDVGTPVIHPKFEVISKKGDVGQKRIYSEDYSEEIDPVNNLSLYEGRIWDGDCEVTEGHIVSHSPKQSFRDAIHSLGWFTPEGDGYKWVEKDVDVVENNTPTSTLGKLLIEEMNRQEIPLPNP